MNRVGHGRVRTPYRPVLRVLACRAIGARRRSSCGVP